MLTGLRGLAQAFVRGAVRIGMKVTETYWSLQSIGLSYFRREFDQDFARFERQDYIYTEVRYQDPDQLIKGELHEKSVWNLSMKYRYEVDTPYLTDKGESIQQTTTVASMSRLTPNEVFEQAEGHKEQYQPENAVIDGDQEISAVWVR